MNYTIKELGDCRVEITVEVEKDVWVGAQKTAMNKALAGVQIKGFRKGKAPAQEVQKILHELLDS